MCVFCYGLVLSWGSSEGGRMAQHTAEKDWLQVGIGTIPAVGAFCLSVF